MEANNTISILTKAFDEHGLKYRFSETELLHEIRVPFGVKSGPFVNVRYILTGRGNDISIRIMNLINKVPEEKRYSVIEACNALNNKYRFLKFVLDADNDINVEYDLPVSTGDDCLGEMAFEIFIRTIQILNEGYILFVKALYTSDLSLSGRPSDADLLDLLKDKHDGINITISKTSSSDPTEG